MRRQKRDMNTRAFERGYQAGISGKSSETCPHLSEEPRIHWISGWREGHADHLDGYLGVSGIHTRPG
ncbi:MAG: ribosome modulation factor [Pseudomonadota bacterium]